jgi:hypothetical protein
MKGRRAKSPGAPGQSIFPRDAVPFHPLRPVSSIHSAAPLADADWVHGIKHELHCRNGQAMRLFTRRSGSVSSDAAKESHSDGRLPGCGRRPHAVLTVFAISGDRYGSIDCHCSCSHRLGINSGHGAGGGPIADELSLVPQGR